jgi:VWFA-related protein
MIVASNGRILGAIIKEQSIMAIHSFFKKFCIVLLLPLLFACGGGDVDTYPEPNISVSSSYDFGGIVLDNSSDKTFAITNTGTESLTIGSIAYPVDPFIILADTCSNKTLAENRSCSVSVRFSPTIQAVFADKVSIPSNDPNGTVAIGLSGEGYGLNVWIDKVEADAFCNVTVDVYVTSPLIDHRIDTLTDLDFLLFENGLGISTIDAFQNLVPSPVSVVLAIDWSESVENVIDPTIKAAAITFIDSLNPATDEAAACKFDGDIELDPLGSPFYYTVDYSDLITYINNDFSGSTGTDLYDAVYDSIDRAVLGGNDKKAVIVLSDGVNEASGDPTPDATLAQVIAHAIDEEIPVFTIYYRDPDYGDGGYGNPEVMEQLAEATGGKYYDGSVGGVDLADVYQQISNILTSKYTIEYESEICSGDVSLEVLVNYDWNPPELPLSGQESGTITFP